MTLATATLQREAAASVPPVNVIVEGAVVVSEPPQTVVGLLVPTVTPEGRVSVKLTPESAVPAFGFVRANVRVDVPPTATVAGETIWRSWAATGG